MFEQLCPNDHRVPLGAQFCGKCGLRVTEPETSVEPAMVKEAVIAAPSGTTTPDTAPPASSSTPFPLAAVSPPPEVFPPAAKQLPAHPVPPATTPIEVAQTIEPEEAPRNKKTKAIVLVAVLVVVVGAAIGLLAGLSSHKSHTNGVATRSSATTALAARSATTAATAPATTEATAPATTEATAPATTVIEPTTESTIPSEQTAAQALATLLSNSVGDRAAVQSAVNDVLQCGLHLPQDAEVFSSASSSRANLITQLNELPGSSTLPTGLLQDLAGAWTASQQADDDFAAWAQDQYTQGCTPNSTSDSHYLDATTPDNQATAYKSTFASIWNPIATEYGLPTYTQQTL
jgi:hypothetical protein